MGLRRGSPPGPGMQPMAGGRPTVGPLLSVPGWPFGGRPLIGPPPAGDQPLLLGPRADPFGFVQTRSALTDARG